MQEALLATKRALESIQRQDWIAESYCNRRGLRGVLVRFFYAGQHHKISIHNCENLPEPAELAEVIAGIRHLNERKSGIYVNGRYVQGFYATARSPRLLDGSQDHWYMICRSHE
jgi:hypothetical protein